MKKYYYTLAICFGLLTSTNIYCQTIDKAKLEAKIDALVPSQVRDTTPGLVVGVVHKGNLVFSKGYGLANLAYNMPNDSKKVYNIGSVSKQFLGYAFAMLHVSGDLNVDDPVTKYLDNWPTFEHKVTLRHLLTHTSGYREAYTMSNLAGRFVGTDRLTRQECLDVVRKQPKLEFVPGSKYTYNSTAWVILSEILEKVTKVPADKWVEDNILKPLKMNDTQIESAVGEVIYNTAESYSYNYQHGFINLESNRAIFGAAEVYTNMLDIVKWINNYKTAEIGGEKVKQLFLDPFILNDGFNSTYAFGIYVDMYKGLKRYWHTGGHEAFNTQLSYFPEADLGIVIISNYGGRGRIDTGSIADYILKNKLTIDTDNSNSFKNNLEGLEGLYVANSNNNTLTLKVEKGELILNRNTKLISISKNKFKIKGTDIVFELQKKGQSISFKVHRNLKRTFTKVEKWKPNVNQLKPFEGKYWSDELETVYHIVLKKKKLKIQHRWLGEISLTPVSKDFFRTQFGFFVKFNRNDKGAIKNLSISSGRTLDVVFKRKD